jgi:hypothetical protein
MHYIAQPFISVGVILLISLLVSLIKAHQDLDLMTLICLSSICLAIGFAIKVITGHAIHILTTCEKFPNSYSRNERQKISLYGRKFMRACKPLKYRVALLFTLERDTFTKLIGVFVMENVINLILRKQ